VGTLTILTALRLCALWPFIFKSALTKLRFKRLHLFYRLIAEQKVDLKPKIKNFFFMLQVESATQRKTGFGAAPKCVRESLQGGERGKLINEYRLCEACFEGFY